MLTRGEYELLLVRRAAGVAKGGAWCFPGGHVEPFETSRRAIVRELREELGIDVEPTEKLGFVRVMDTRHILAVWRVRHVAGEICPVENEVAEVRWVDAREVPNLPFGLASNERVLKMLGYGLDGRQSMARSEPRP